MEREEKTELKPKITIQILKIRWEITKIDTRKKEEKTWCNKELIIWKEEKKDKPLIMKKSDKTFWPRKIERWLKLLESEAKEVTLLLTLHKYKGLLANTINNLIPAH